MGEEPGQEQSDDARRQEFLREQDVGLLAVLDAGDDERGGDHRHEEDERPDDPQETGEQRGLPRPGTGRRGHVPLRQVPHAAVVLEGLHQQERHEQPTGDGAGDRVAVAVRQVAPHRPERGHAVEVREEREEHREAGDALDDELSEVGEDVGPQSAEGHVEHGADAGQGDAPPQRDAGEALEQQGDGDPLGGDVDDFQGRAAVGEDLLGGQVVADGEVGEW